jgi:hypothetical protein
MADDVRLLGQVGPQSSGLGPVQAVRLTPDGSVVVSDLHGDYYESNVRGNMFVGASASAGIAILLPATTGGHPTLFNPLGSGVNVSITRLELSYVSGTHAPGAFEWAKTLSAGAAAATGAAILTATAVTAVPAMLGGTGVSKVIWSPTTNTFTAAPTFYRPVGIGLHTGASATAINPDVLIVDYKGDLVIAPGNAISLCYQTTTTTALFQVGLTWEEIPVL